MTGHGARKGTAGGPQLRKSGGPELRKSGGTHPRKSGGSDQRKFCNLQRLAPEAENGGGKFVRALLGQKVAAALGRTALYRAALYTVADRRDRCAQGVP